MIPKVINRTNIISGKTYRHIFTEDEQLEIAHAIVKGEKQQDVIKRIRDSLTENDWEEV